VPVSGEDAGGEPLDAGGFAPSDAGGAHDAGPVDAGPLDAGASDAGQPDAGPADAGATTDAGLVDAGLPDAGLDAGVDAGAPDAGPLRSGQLLGGTGAHPGPIAGLRYSAGPWVSGVTDDAGTYLYPADASVTFQLADVTFRPVPGGPRLSPFQLVGTGACNHSAELERALVLLYSLDVDGDPATGTVLAPTTQPAARAFSTLSLADVTALVSQLIPGRVALSTTEATDRFVAQIDDEAWGQVGLDTFSGLDALPRGQGVATDGTNFWFSGTVMLERTDLAFNRAQLSAYAIPLQLASAGSNHIGDIDVSNGTLWAPLEDGSGYQHPKVVQFNPQTLSAGTVYDIPQALQTQGVPWVAVNPDAGELYLAEWNPTTQLNIFSMATVQLQRSLPMRPPTGVTVGRVQGAKLFEGALYLASDDATKSVFKLNIETGTVLRLFGVAITSEQEGLAFLARPDGGTLHTLNVNATSTGSELRHHERTRQPVRKLVCP
jgi:hypothetical protein